MNDCLFCKIVNKEIPSHCVYEDEDVYAFLDIAPVTKGHTLVIPKTHSESILEMQSEDLTKVMLASQMIANRLKTVLGAQGINIQVNAGEKAGQVIFHTHIHLIPRYGDDTLTLWSKGYEYTDGEEKRIATELNKG